MSRVFITGSADGLGLMAARLLIADGHEVFLHARSRARGEDALVGAPGAAGVLLGDLSSIRQTRDLAESANAEGRFDAVIHNAGVGYRERRTETEDGLEHVFAINVLAPFLLTALVERPDRLIYLSSGMHQSGDPDFADLQWEQRRWSSGRARLGGNEDGRGRSARRSSAGSVDPGVAGRGLGDGRHHRRLLLPSPAAASGPARSGQGGSSDAARELLIVDRRRASGVTDRAHGPGA
jgi:NAD(P)-dependent dehydrogenase (short-subunit alcohol dehydrogenase family)